MDNKKAILIRGGTIVTTEGMWNADLLTEGEKIAAIGHNLTAPPGAEIVEAEGLLLLPGVIDAHVHIQLDTGIYKTPDDWFTESRAASFGGVTTVVDFATQFKGEGLREAVENRLQEAAPSVIDYALHVMVTDLPAGKEDDLAELVDVGATSIKLYTTYRPNYYADDATIFRLLKAAARHGLMTLIHCENDAMVTAQTEALVKAGKTAWRYHGQARPAFAENEAAHRILFLAEEAQAPVVIAHNSSARTSILVAEARENGQVAFCETGPQYLILDNRGYESDEPWRYILQPPLRDPEEKERLWAAVAEGMVDMIITDHCDYTKAQKIAVDDFTKTPGGLPGLETSLPLIVTYGVEEGWIDWTDLVALMAANPAQIYGLWPRKGALLPGFDADIVLYDPEPEGVITAEALHTLAGYTPYEGLRIKGRVVSTIRRGAFTVRDGQFVAEQGTGRYIPRAPQFWT